MIFTFVWICIGWGSLGGRGNTERCPFIISAAWVLHLSLGFQLRTYLYWHDWRGFDWEGVCFPGCCIPAVGCVKSWLSPMTGRANQAAPPPPQKSHHPTWLLNPREIWPGHLRLLKPMWGTAELLCQLYHQLGGILLGVPRKSINQTAVMSHRRSLTRGTWRNEAIRHSLDE